MNLFKQHAVLSVFSTRRKRIVSLSVVILIAVITVLAFLVLTNHKSDTQNDKHVKGTKSSQTQNSTPPNSKSSTRNPVLGDVVKDEPSNQASTYTSSQNPYSFQYPSNWQAVPDNWPNGNEQIDVSPKVESSPGNSFLLTFAVSSVQNSTRLPGAAPNGTVTTLPSGSLIWEQNEAISLREGSPQISCPELQVISKNSAGEVHFSVPLANGKYLAVQGSFCWNERSAPTYSYQQQLTSSEWLTAKDILDSLKVTN